LTLDTGALFALERHRKGMADVVAAVREGGDSITAPVNHASEMLPPLAAMRRSWRGMRREIAEMRRQYFVGPP